MGSVSGVVTLDGEPLPGVAVMFDPEGFRASRGFTDSSGGYELTYLRDIKGAVVGEHRVYVSVVPDGGAPVDSLPSIYNTKSELTAKVERGRNVFDWALESPP